MAGKIDQLNFEVLLRDEKFSMQVERDIKLAKRLNTTLTQLLDVRRKLNTSSTRSQVEAERVAAAAARTALAEQKVRTEAEKTALAHQKVKKAMEDSAKHITGGGMSLTRAWLRFSATMWSIVSIIRIFTRAIGSAIKKISEFEQANANLATIMQVSRRTIRPLTEDALMLGRTTEWTAMQVTELQTALAKLGYNMPQIRNMQASVLQFATSVSANLPDAANLAGAALRMFGMHSTETKKALEILTASTNKTALDFEKLKVSLPYVGAIAHSIGFDIADTASLLGVLANSGLAASRTGTGLRQVLLRLANGNGALQAAMGGNIKTFDDFVNGLQALRDSGIEAGEAQKLVGDRAGAALLILANGVDDIRRLNREVRDTDGLLKNIQAERLDTLHGSTLLLRSAWEGLIQTFRESAGPMKDIVDWLTKIVNATSLAASRANRVAQGTKNVIGSDDLTKQFTEQFDSLIASGKTPEVAAEIVQGAMDAWLRGAYGDLADLQHRGYSETPFKRFLYKMPITHFFVSGKMNKGRAANEQVEAMENAMDSVLSYMASRSSEEGEIAAQNYLEQWRMVFDTQGEKAVRDAMAGVVGYDNIKSQIEAYIANGGMEGAEERGKGPKIKETEDERQRRIISGLRASVSLLEKFRSAYDKLEPLIGADAARGWVLENMGHDVANLDAEFEKLIADLRNYGDEGNEAADAIEARLGLDLASKAVKEYTEAQRALEQYQRAFEKFDKDWGTGDTAGAANKAEKALRKHANEQKKIEDEWTDFLDAAKKANKEVTKSEEELYEARKKANDNQLFEDMRGLVDDIFKEKFNGKELTDWSHKSLSDIRGIKQEVESMEIPPEIKAMVLERGGATALEELQKAFDAYRQSLVEGTIAPELFRKSAKYAKQVASYISKAGDAMERLGEATNDLNLSDAGAALSAIGQNLSAAAEGYEKTGSWIGAVVGGAVDLFDQIIDAVAGANEEMRAMADTIRKIRIEANETRFNQILSADSDSIFGENFVRRVKNATTALGWLRESLGKVERGMRNLYASQMVRESENGGRDFDTLHDILLASIEKGDAGDLQFRTAHSFWGGDTFETLSELADKFGMEIKDANGNLNPDLLQTILDTYGDLNEESKEWLSDAIQYSEQYAKALDEIEDATKDIFDNLASDMTDKFIDNFLAMGNAVDDLSDTFADLGDAILRSFLQSYILDEILGKYQDEAKGMLSKYANGGMTPDEYAAWLAGFADNVQKESEAVAPAINGMIEAFKDRGLMNIDEGTAGTVGAGIKSITEETANLLASYINAIRADVSVMRGLQEKGFATINAFGDSIPTLNDYIAQIAATNFDIAQSNQSILSELRSVIGSPGTSGMVVRVEYA